MAPELLPPCGSEGDNVERLKLPPTPLHIPPEHSPPTELEAGNEGFSPDRLLQTPVKSAPNAISMKTQSMLRLPPPPPPPPAPLLRKVCLRCCSSDTKEQWVCQRYAICVLWGLWGGCYLFAAGVAILIVYWSLFPLCTGCQKLLGSADSSSSAIEIATMSSSNAGASVEPFSTLRINQLQVMGTHNSYHRRSGIPTFGGMWPYDYPSIPAQLDAGVRHLELDVHYDWKTGRWVVFHISVVDPLSSCYCLRSCLDEIRAWSDLHPMHHIIFMDIELKLTGDFFRLCGDLTPAQDHAAFRSLQNTILEAFPPERILTPKTVQGDYDTIYEAVNAGGSCIGGRCGSNVSSRISGEETVGAVPGMAGGWPLVDDTRGMFAFVMDYQTVNLKCREGFRKSLPINETVFFEMTPRVEVNTLPPYGAFTQLCQCGEKWKQQTRARLKKGFIVRQKPDDSTWVVPGADGLTTPFVVTGDETFLAKTPAQLLVSDDNIRGVNMGVCRSRCSTLVPEEECILEGFC